MALLPIKIPAGFFRNATQYQAKNRWYKGNLVRFSEGRLRPIGGWQRLADTQIIQKGAVYELKIETAGSGYSNGTLAFTGGGGASFTGAYTVSTVGGVAGVITGVSITNSGSGFTSIPTVTISGSTSGITAVITAKVFNAVDPIRGLHSWRLGAGARYLLVGSVQSLRLWDGSQSAGTNAPLYDITPTDASVPSGTIAFKDQKDFLISGLGYGAMEYGGDRNLDGTGGTASGGDTYGTARYAPIDPDIQDADAWRDNYVPTWQFDSFGDDAIGVQSGQGSIWYVDVSALSFNNSAQTATPAVLLSSLANSTGVPEDNVGVLVTPERHIMIIGAGGNKRKIAWGHQESLTDFTPSVTNTAGDLEIQTRGRIVGGFKSRYGILLFFTDSVWKTNYLGTPYIYGVERLSEGGGCLGMKSVAGSADFVAWMSRGRFWSFTGGYITELACDVGDYVFSDINTDLEGLVSGGHNAEFGEITWFYPKEGDEYCTRYVTYSYREKHWTTGELERSAWESSDSLGFPVAGGVDGYLYRHELDPDTQSTPILRESNVTAPADVEALSGIESRVMAKGVDSAIHPNVASEEHLCFAETGAIEIGGGNKLMSVKSIITDTDAGDKGLRMKVTVADTPDDSTPIVEGAYDLTADGYTDTRFTGRQALLRVESPFDQEWRFGEVRFDATQAGKR
tara:strand:- start:1714 stop:3753 length:2040 start_codon:yes stop_codon:yes gene_type:complete